jgi:outer membrane protein OmpA-like peptidoglycan-associated protein
MRYPLLAAPLLLALMAGAGAQELKLYGAQEAVDPQDVARILGAPAAPAYKTRSLKLLDDAAPAAVVATAVTQAPAQAPEARPALALQVQFAFDSADILPAARGQLDALADGIRLLPASTSVVIEGHTDATGPEQYNELLSQRRAFSVKQYLVALHGISPARLRAVGLGEYAPLPGRDAYAPENRRVQFHGE